MKNMVVIGIVVLVLCTQSFGCSGDKPEKTQPKKEQEKDTADNNLAIYLKENKDKEDLTNQVIIVGEEAIEESDRQEAILAREEALERARGVRCTRRCKKNARISLCGVGVTSLITWALWQSSK